MNLCYKGFPVPETPAEPLERFCRYAVFTCGVISDINTDLIVHVQADDSDAPASVMDHEIIAVAAPRFEPSYVVFPVKRSLLLPEVVINVGMGTPSKNKFQITTF